MTKEELEKEAEESFEQYKVTDEDYVVSPYSDDMGEKMLMYNDEYYAEETYLRLYTQGYLAGAEPREKRIAELEATCNKWFEHLKNREEELLNELNNQNAKYNKQIADLEKENAELKGLVNQYKASKCSGISLANRNMIMSVQLTKAKEIIREFVEWANWQGNSKCPSFKSIQDKAEQFLKDSEVKKL